MPILVYNSPQGFLADAENWLQERPGRHDLILGIVQRLTKPEAAAARDAYLSVVTEGREPAAVAAMTPPFKLLLAGDDQTTDDHLLEIARDLSGQAGAVPGVNGPAPLSRRFAGLWQAVTGRRVALHRRLGCHVLYHVVAPGPIGGRMRPATAADLDTVHLWADAFQTEALHEPAPATLRHELAQRVEEGSIFLWCDPQPVSMAATTRPTGRSMTVNLVYTPPALRGRGYARNCVAAVSRMILAGGYQYCTLFTDLANPTANRLYRAIGYQWVCDFEEFAFPDP